MVVGDVVAGKSIVASTGLFHDLVVLGNMHRPAKHQVFKEVRESGFIRLFIARTDIVQDVQDDRLAVRILMVDYP